jgi:hypothetical protein
MADTLDCTCYQCFIHIICIILKTKKVKERVGRLCIPTVGWKTNYKLAQQGLPIVNGNKIPQETRLGDLYLRAIIGANNKSGVV